MHQMGFAEADPAVEEERVKRHHMNRVGASLGDASRRSMGEFVGFADDEILESEALVERRELRLVLADFERAGGLGQGRNGAKIFRLAVGRMVEPIASGGGRHDHRDAGHPLVLRPPERQESVSVMRRDPVAQEACRRGDDRLAVIDPLHAHRSQPATVGGFANLVLEVVQNPDPFVHARTCRGIGVPDSNRFRHHRIPPKI